ncbi:MAG: undecaprenyl-diphosphate phosphatase [Acidilobaceae archaeon]|nr:undecaprenyl-diphosphate phosphatase [Acidilobaceae archaeon]MCX8165357.1 undecaprenyl-diphosphate phosphatase [Acidilobaceae archaeon]MDW7973783.1 undecaprenyl-diphosphate phosphatase [Sulfolobales archaeon]
MRLEEQLLLGVLQGVFEWLPVSSKTVLLLTAALLGYPLSSSYSLSLALQAGTVLSALAYYWRELPELLSDSKVIRFLLISTTVTAAVGTPLYLLAREMLSGLGLSISTIAIGAALLAQGIFRREGGEREEVRHRDSLLFGVAQGLAVLPGISRSGITVTLLLYLSFSPARALKLSFLASIPANLGALLVTLLFEGVAWGEVESLLPALLVSAAVGLATMGALIELARRRGRELTLAMGAVTLLLGAMTI